MIKAVVFDMDGVVFDTERIYRTAWRLAADDLGGIPEIDADIRVCTGRNNADIGAYFHGKYGEDFPFETLMERRSAHIDAYVRAHDLPFKSGVPEIFSWLRENGFLVALATSTNQRRAGEYLKIARIADAFDRVVTGNMVAHSKPRPDIYLKACEELGVLPEESVAVEDSPNGLLSGHDAGMTTVMIPDLIPPSEVFAETVSFVCRDMEELKQLLEKLNRENK